MPLIIQQVLALSDSGHCGTNTEGHPGLNNRIKMANRQKHNHSTVTEDNHEYVMVIIRVMKQIVTCDKHLNAS